VEQEERKVGKVFDDGSHAIVGAFIEVHRHLGPGLLESAYDACLAREFSVRQIPFERRVSVPVVYKGIGVATAYQLDFLVAGRFVVELKAVTQVLPIHVAQVLTYMKLMNVEVGFLVNFNETVLRRGLRRLSLRDYAEHSSGLPPDP
jgi:GxxExxY protein